MDIPGWRRKIDEIDKEILRLLNERAECSIAVGKIKREKQLPVMSREREEEIMRRLVENNPGPLKNDQIRQLFSLILEHSRTLQNNI